MPSAGPRPVRIGCSGWNYASWKDEFYEGKPARTWLGDRPEVKEFQSHELTTDWTYVRFHYGSHGRRGNYSRSELEEWARRFEDWRHQVEIYAYFNNDWEVFAIRNVLWLKKRLAA